MISFGARSKDRRSALAEGFAAVVGFFTCIPVAARTGPPIGERPLADAAWAFPLVGAGIGAIAAFVFLAAQLARLGDWPAALLAILAGILLTGALHEDGLADTADGIFGAADREGRLAIMRDSRHGTYAVLALLISVALRAAALAQIGEIVFAGLALVSAHAVSRAALPLLMSILPPARSDGLGVAAGRPQRGTVISGLLIALAILAAALGPVPGLIAVGFTAAALATAAFIVQRRIGGYTGDVLGAFQQIAEVTILLAALALR